LHGLLEHLHGLVALRGGEERQQVVALRVRAHPAGVPPGVPLEGALVVLYDRHRVDAGVGHECHQTELFAVEPLFEDETVRSARDAPHPASEAGAFVLCHEVRPLYEHALAAREADRFHDERLREGGDGGVQVAESVDRGELRHRLHAVSRQELSAEPLRGLDPRRGPVRPDDGDARGPERVGHSRGQGRLRADDSEVDLLQVSKSGDPGGVLDGRAEARLRDLFQPRVGVRSGGEHRRLGAVTHLREDVLAGAPSDYQDSHRRRCVDEGRGL
jgi:hypothetical protein